MKKQNELRRKILHKIEQTAHSQSGYRRLPVTLRVVGGLVVCILLGTFLLTLPISSTAVGPLPLNHALFTATSALTVSGLSLITISTELTFFGQVVLLILIQIGGVGYMFVAALVLRLVGRRVPFLDRLALSNSLGLSKPEAILRILRHVFVGILIVEGIGTLLLYAHWRLNGILPEEHALFYALFHAVSAFCNAGFDLFTGLPSHPHGIPRDSVTLIIMGALIFIGGLGIPILSELLTWWSHPRFSLHFKINMIAIMGLFLLGWIGMFVSERQSHGVLADQPLVTSVVQAGFQSISARTAGFAGLPNYEEITPATQLLTLVLMFIGCAPASMGGGITTGTFSVIGLMLWSYARDLPQAQAFQRTISPNTVRRAGAVLSISVGLVMLSTFLILLTHRHLSLDVVLFEVVSAFATCGLSLGITGELNWFGQGIIMLMMFWGRLGALTIVIAVSQVRSGPHLVGYAEEPVLIG